eukprot:scaffold103388_cov38-Prasinocladus_malaysianus.AAC.1
MDAHGMIFVIERQHSQAGMRLCGCVRVPPYLQVAQTRHYLILLPAFVDAGQQCVARNHDCL